MAYVEWLRVKKCLTILAIVLAAIFLIAVVVRISVNGAMSGMTDWQQEVGGDAIVSTTRLPDGSTRTTYTDRKDGSTVTVTDRGYDGKHIHIVDRHDRHRSTFKMAHVGPLLVERGAKNGEYDIDTNNTLDIGFVFSIVSIIGLIVATSLAAPLGRENERLEIAWAKPIDRTLYALHLYGVDAVGIAASLAMSAIVALLCMALFQLPHLILTPGGVWRIVLSLVLGLAWYAMYAGLTSWMKRGIGAVIGLAWPVGLVVPGLALAPLQGSSVGSAFHWIFQVIAAVDPLGYLHLTEVGEHGNIGLYGLDDVTKFAILAAMIVVYAGIGLIEWRRVEA